jgi:hypothetical protein
MVGGCAIALLLGDMAHAMANTSMGTDAGAGLHAEQWSQRVQDFNVEITRKTCPRDDALKVNQLNETPKGQCAPTLATISKELHHNAVRHRRRLAEAAEKMHRPPPPFKNVSQSTASGWNGLKFFLLEEGAFNFSSIITCFSRAVQLPKGVDYEDRWDSRVLPNVAEHLTELAALRAFRVHPARVYSLADADVKVVGHVGFLSYAASKLKNWPCGNIQGHMRRMNGVALALLSMPEFRATGGTDFVRVSTYWNQSKALGDALDKALSNPGLTGDLDFQPLDSLVETAVVIPYLPHFLLERSAAGVADAPSRASPATVSHMFRGNMHRKAAGSYRIMLQNLAKSWPLSEVKDSQFDSWESKNSKHHHKKVLKKVNGKWTDLTPPVVKNWPSETTARLYLHSKMCLVPAGDTATSRRLFDALAAGCVPVFFAHHRDIIANLPFPNVIDWASIAIFAGSLECIAGRKCDTNTWNGVPPPGSTCAGKEGMACWNAAECHFDDISLQNATKVTLDGRTADWLGAIASSVDGNAALECMSMRGRETFRTYLSYRTGGFVTGLLHELESRFVWPRTRFDISTSSSARGALRVGDWHNGER